MCKTILRFLRLVELQMREHEHFNRTQARSQAAYPPRERPRHFAREAGKCHSGLHTLKKYVNRPHRLICSKAIQQNACQKFLPKFLRTYLYKAQDVKIKKSAFLHTICQSIQHQQSSILLIGRDLNKHFSQEQGYEIAV